MAILAAALGPTAKTALCIFTPVGTPNTGRLLSTAFRMSRAVPSPPQKTRRSAPASVILLASFIVSSAVVSFFFFPRTAHAKPRFRASSSPSLPAPTTSRILPLTGFISERKDSALAGAMGFAPRIIALSRIAFPSVPLSPTAPPIPAMGLTMNPTVFRETSFEFDNLRCHFRALMRSCSSRGTFSVHLLVVRDRQHQQSFQRDDRS